MQPDRRTLSYANVAATVALVLAALAAGPVVAQPVVSATTSATSAVKRALGLSKAADRRSKKAIRLARKALRPPSPGVIAPPGPAGERGPTGPTGPAGSDAEFNGATAGGDLEGTYPNPLIATGALDPSNFGVVPAVSAFSTTVQSVDNEEPYAVKFDHEYFDTAEMHLTDEEAEEAGEGEDETEKVFAPIDGVYQVSATVTWEEHSEGIRRLFLVHNENPNHRASDRRSPVPHPEKTSQTVTALINLKADDFVEAHVFQDRGGELGVWAQTGLTPILSMVWVAPL